MKKSLRGFERVVEQQAAELLWKHYEEEIERAVADVKRSAWDKWFQREWHRAAGRDRRQRGAIAASNRHGYVVDGAWRPR